MINTLLSIYKFDEEKTLHSVLGKEEERHMLHQMQALAQKQVVEYSLTKQ